MGKPFRIHGKSILPKSRIVLVTLCITSLISCTQKDRVKFSEEPFVLPTYGLGQPEVNPQFYTPKDVQGTKGNVYPYPMQDQLTDKKTDVTYKALILENEFIKICIISMLKYTAKSKKGNIL